MERDISAIIKSRRRGGWEDAMRRLASFSKCLLRFKVTGVEISDMSGGGELMLYKAEFSLNVKSGKTYPKKFRLMHPDFAKKDGAYALKARNYTEFETEYAETRPKACERYLKMVAGQELGVCDAAPNPSGYMEEIFRPVLTVPKFSSLKELNIKLEVMGA